MATPSYSLETSKVSTVHNIGNPHNAAPVDSWVSPAFLKRTHAARLSYDPFADDSTDFPDNDRRKKLKFGSGFRQWRFTSRSPSPEKHEDAFRAEASKCAPDLLQVLYHNLKEEQHDNYPKQNQTELISEHLNGPSHGREWGSGGVSGGSEFTSFAVQKKVTTLPPEEEEASGTSENTSALYHGNDMGPSTHQPDENRYLKVPIESIPERGVPNQEATNRRASEDPDSTQLGQSDVVENMTETTIAPEQDNQILEFSEQHDTAPAAPPDNFSENEYEGGLNSQYSNSFEEDIQADDDQLSDRSDQESQTGPSTFADQVLADQAEDESNLSEDLSSDKTSNDDTAGEELIPAEDPISEDAAPRQISADLGLDGAMVSRQKVAFEESRFEAIEEKWTLAGTGAGGQLDRLNEREVDKDDTASQDLVQEMAPSFDAALSILHDKAIMDTKLPEESVQRLVESDSEASSQDVPAEDLPEDHKLNGRNDESEEASDPVSPPKVNAELEEDSVQSAELVDTVRGGSHIGDGLPISESSHQVDVIDLESDVEDEESDRHNSFNQALPTEDTPQDSVTNMKERDADMTAVSIRTGASQDVIWKDHCAVNECFPEEQLPQEVEKHGHVTKSVILAEFPQVGDSTELSTLEDIHNLNAPPEASLPLETADANLQGSQDHKAGSSPPEILLEETTYGATYQAPQMLEPEPESNDRRSPEAVQDEHNTMVADQEIQDATSQESGLSPRLPILAESQSVPPLTQGTSADIFVPKSPELVSNEPTQPRTLDEQSTDEHLELKIRRSSSPSFTGALGFLRAVQPSDPNFEGSEETLDPFGTVADASELIVTEAMAQSRANCEQEAHNPVTVDVGEDITQSATANESPLGQQKSSASIRVLEVDKDPGPQERMDKLTDRDETELAAPDNAANNKNLLASEASKHRKADNELQVEVEEKPISDNKSSLIRRIKEQRRLSSLRQSSRLSGADTASPWFAPRQHDQNLPDTKSPKAEDTPIIKPFTRARARGPSLSTPPEEYRPNSSIRSASKAGQPKIPRESNQNKPILQKRNGFRTSLSYFVPLASLESHYGALIDVLAVVVASRPVTRAEAGPKDHSQSVYLADPSTTQEKASSSNAVTLVQFFRPRKTSLPSVIPGDAILVRDFKVQSFQNNLSLLSTDSSAWAVFRKDSDVQVRGPPIEYGPEERAFARAHWNWWESLEDSKRTSLTAIANKAGFAETTSEFQKLKAPKGSRKRGLGFEIGPSVKSESARTPRAKSAKTSKSAINKKVSERSLGLDGSDDSEIQGKEALTPSTPSRMILRSNRDKCRISESPEKEQKFSRFKRLSFPGLDGGDGDIGEQIRTGRHLQSGREQQAAIHELRDGTKYTDGAESQGENSQELLRFHQLRDGRVYHDRG